VISPARAILRNAVGVLAFAIVLAISGCQAKPSQANESRDETPSPQVSEAVPAFPTRLADDLPGLHNVVSASEGIFSGSEPDGDEGFSSLARLRVKTIVSVDGARPNLEAARKQGIRYVHIPIGYAGVPDRAALALARVARKCERPVYIHCHHGRHRGPAATAIACLARGTMQAGDALKILDMAGTGKEYAGLWRVVENFSSPPSDAELPELVEVAKVESLVAAMASVDRHCDGLKACRDANWQAPTGHPDLSPLQESLLLREALHEAGRVVPDGKFDFRFKSWLAEAETVARQFEMNLQQSRYDEAEKQFLLLERSCKQCHAKYRN
jgi:hypothetical protein